jgi:hypothetical protein
MLAPPAVDEASPGKDHPRHALGVGGHVGGGQGAHVGVADEAHLLCPDLLTDLFEQVAPFSASKTRINHR